MTGCSNRYTMADSNRGPGPLPERWLRCPRKAEQVLTKFLAFKTPLDEKFNDQIPIQYRFTPTMLFDYAQSTRIRLGLWISLTKTKRFYDSEQVDTNNCKYVKLSCDGHKGAPDEDQTRTFVRLCATFIDHNPLSTIAVHCTHGFNRTGFLIAAFLVEHFDYSVETAIREFARVRPPGIYKEAYIRELYKRYHGDDSVDPPPAPQLPDWCFESNADVLSAADACRSGQSGGGSVGRKRRISSRIKENPTFMEGVPGIEPVIDREEVTRIRQQVRRLTGSEFESFLGSQPVSMNRQNIALLAEKPYRVSWKADGTRYMMLILAADEVYFIDRDNSAFRVRNLQFFQRKCNTKPLTNTLLDGEMVIDQFNGAKIPRYLIYDIVIFEGNNIGEEPFYPTRYRAIETEIIDPRIDAMKEARIVKEQEPFSVRVKPFYELYYSSHLLGEKFSRQLTHPPDGLIFQPSKEPYVYGTSPMVLKWKPESMNSIDFRLQVNRVTNVGCLPEYIGNLLTGSGRVFGKIKCDKKLRELNGKIIECKLKDNRWVFMRERTDKSFANADRTAEFVYETIKSPVTQAMLLEFIEKRGYKDPMPPPMAPPPLKRQKTN